MVEDFAVELHNIDEMMRKRNDVARRKGISASGDAYIYLQPSRVPNGIAI